MECYLDNSATTALDEEAAELMNRISVINFGNPSSLHHRGFEAQQYIKEAAYELSKILRCTEKEVFFTSGGTESNNTAIIGAAINNKRRDKHIITTRIEHAAVLSPVRFLEERGYKVDFLEVDGSGHIDLDELRDKLTPDTLLVSIMHVNNEIGAVEPIMEAGKIIKEKSPGCLFHVDDIQGFGKLKLIPKDNNIDLLSVSAHKLHGPKGVGLLYVKKKTKISPLIFGGGQQSGFRSGTENVPGIAGFALAAKKKAANMEADIKKFEELKNIFLSGLNGLEGINVNGGDVPYIISLTADGVRAEVLLHALEEKGVYVSAGSACSSNKPAVSETLKAIGVKKEALDSTVRVSLSRYNTEEEMIYASQCFKDIVPQLRRFKRH